VSHLCRSGTSRDVKGHSHGIRARDYFRIRRSDPRAHRLCCVWDSLRIRDWLRISCSRLDCRKGDQEGFERDWRLALSNRGGNSDLRSSFSGGRTNRNFPISQVRKAHKTVIHSPQIATAEADPTVQVRPSSTPTPPPQTLSKGALAERLLLLGLASPFLNINETPHAIIGLFILFIGLRIAWQLTDETPAQVVGPFKSSSAPASPLSSP
jgi:hypothetical protein